MSRLKWAGLIGFVVLVGVGVESSLKSDSESAQARQVDPKAGKRAALAMAVNASLKKALKDPGSLSYETLRVDEAGEVACAEFRAKSSFGALDKGYVVYAKGRLSTNEPSAWNKHCRASMYDQALLFR